MNRKPGILIFEKNQEEEWEVTLKSDDGGTNVKLANFGNPQKWYPILHNEKNKIDFFKKKKQIRVYYLVDSELLFDSTKDGNENTYSRPNEENQISVQSQLNQGLPSSSNNFRNKQKTKPKRENFYSKGKNNEHTYLPKDTRELLRLSQIDNAHLKLNRAIQFFAFDKGKMDLLDEKKKKGALLFRNKFKIKDSDNGREKQFAVFEKGFFGSKKTKGLFIEVLARQKKMISDFFSTIPFKSLKQKLDWRMITGLGAASVYETNIAMHFLYGIPFVPSTSIKGVLRSWIIQNCFNNSPISKVKSEELEKKAMQDSLFTFIFGSDQNGFNEKANRGKVVFFDAFPMEPPVLEYDIMNVHYPDYYGGEKGPTDDQSPNPIPFLTIGNKGTNELQQHFNFIFGYTGNRQLLDLVGNSELLKSPIFNKISNENTKKKLRKDFDVLSLVELWLADALANSGLGAKTAVGYGYFSNAIE